MPNLAARTLAGRRADAVALALPEQDWRQFAEPFFLEIIRSFGDGLEDTSVQLLLTLVRSGIERQRFIEFERGGQVDGALFISVRAEDRLSDMLAEAGAPTVLLGRRPGDQLVTYVDADNVGGARSAVEHLLRGRSRRIAAGIGPLDMYVTQCRLRGYREALAAAGVEAAPSLVVEGNFTEDSGPRATTELLTRHPYVDAVFAASDTMAAAALGVLQAAGPRVPEDVAVIGSDDFPLAQHTEPSLTTVQQPLDEIGRTKVRLLMQETEQPEVAWRHVILRTRLVVRASA